MIKVSVLYPNSETTKFDMDYYLAHHIPLVQSLLGAALRGVFVEQGISGGQADSSPAYVAMGHLLFDSVQDYQAPSARMSRLSSEIFPTTRTPSRQCRSAR